MRRLVVLAAAFVSLTGLNWSLVGPGSGGYNYIRENKNGITIAATDAGGWYRSLNKGRTWTAHGKANVGGTIGNAGVIATRPGSQCLAFHPTSNRMLIASEGHLLLSTNGGLTATCALDITAATDSTTNTCLQASPVDWVGAIAWDPIIGDTVYAGWNAGDSDQNFFRVFLSTDSGSTWAVRAKRPSASATVGTGLPNSDMRWNKMICQPHANNIVFGMPHDDAWIDSLGADSYKLYRSRDAGLNWTSITPKYAVKTPDVADSVWDFVVHPYNPDTMFCTTWSGYYRTQNNQVGRTFISLDEGNTWTKIGDHTGSIVLLNRGPGVEPLLYVIDPGRDSGTGEAGVWKAAAPWTSFATVSVPANWTVGWTYIVKDGYGRGFREAANTIGVSERDSMTMFWASSQFAYIADTLGLFRPLNMDYAGNNVSRASQWWRTRGLDGAICMDLEVAGPWSYAGFYDQGFCRSSDRGLTWQAVNDSATFDSLSRGYNGHGGNVTALVADPTRSATLWMAWGNGKTNQKLWKSTLAGEPGSFTPAYSQGDTSGFFSDICVDPLSPPASRILFYVSDGDLYKSSDDGTTWARIWDFTGDSLRYVAARGSTVLVGGGSGLWRATDGGVNAASFTRVNPVAAGWTPTSQSANVYELRYTGVHQIQFDEKGGAYLCLGSGGLLTTMGLHRSTDGGATWTQLYTSPTAGSSYVRRFLKSRSGAWWLTSASHTSSSGRHNGRGLARSLDQGATWTDVTTSEGLPWYNAMSMAEGDDWTLIALPGSGLFRASLSQRAPTGRGRR